MREQLNKQNVKEITIKTSVNYKSFTGRHLDRKSLAAIQYILTRAYLSRHFTDQDAVFFPNIHPSLKEFVRALDIPDHSQDRCEKYDKEFAEASVMAVNRALNELNTKQDNNQANGDERLNGASVESFSTVHDQTDSVAGQNNNENNNLIVRPTVQIFDRSAFQLLYENSANIDKEVRRVIKELDEKDTGERQLQPVTAEIVVRILALKEKYPNMRPFLDFVDKHAALSFHNPHQTYYMPPVLLVSSPGLGKTACVKEVAKILGVPFDFVDYSTSSAAWILVGVSSVWSSAKPGLIFEQLVKKPICNGMILCDEIDKSPDEDKYPPINVFYRLLEKDMMVDFQDEFVPQLKLDASRIMYVATANDISKIPAAILSRFHVIHIQPPGDEQLRIIARSIYSSILQAESFSIFADNLKDEVIDQLLGYSPRQIKVALKLAFANAAYRCRYKNTDKQILIEAEDIDFSAIEEFDTRPIGFVW